MSTLKSFFLCLLSIFLFFLQPLSGTAEVFSFAPEETMTVQIKRTPVILLNNVVYKQADIYGYLSKPLTMDLLIPRTHKKMPALVFYPGGYFVASNKSNFIQLCSSFAEKGYVVAAVEYRVAPTSAFPACLQDAKSAIAWLRVHAHEYSIDPDRIGVIGASAGGYIASMMAVTSGQDVFSNQDHTPQSSSIRCAVSLFGVTDLSSFAAYRREKGEAIDPFLTLFYKGMKGMEKNGKTEASLIKKANPLTYVSHTSAPVLFMHGTEDSVVPPEQSEILYKALKKAGVPTGRILLSGAGHGGASWIQQPVLDKIASFLDLYL